jgi:glycosyltransferase involved in cell wall biosynthesis
MARNTGVRLASGDIVVFLDDDFQVPPDVVSRLARHFADPAVAGVTGYVASPTDRADEKMASFRRYVKDPGDLRRPGLIAVDHFFGGFMAFRRDVVQRVGGFDEWIGSQPVAAAEDLEFCMRVRNAGFRLFLDTSITVAHVGGSLAAGGCDKSGLPPDVVVASQMRCLLYAHLKNAAGRGPLGRLRSIVPAYRGFVLNRQMFTADARLMWQRHVGFARALRTASRALAEGRGGTVARSLS